MSKTRITVQSGQDLRKETRLERESKSQKATPAIATISKIVDLLKPWELHPSWKYKTYQEMMRDPDVFSAVESRQTAIEVAQAKPKLKYDKNSERSVFLKNYIEYCLYNVKGSTRQLGRQASEMVYNGVAPFEINTKLSAKDNEFLGTYILDKLTYIDPLTIDASRPFDTVGGGREVTYLRQSRSAFRDTDGRLAAKMGKNKAVGAQLIDMRKVAMSAYGASEGRPFGASPLDAAWVAWKEKILIQEYLLVGIQKDLAGTPVLRVPLQLFEDAKEPKSAAAQTMEDLKTHMANLHAGEQSFVILPSDPFSENGNGKEMYSIQFQGITGNDKNFDLVEILEQKKKTIFTVLGATHLIAGEDGGGSYNLIEGKANIQAHYAERDNILIDEMYNEQIIPLLLKLNGWDNEKLSDIPVYSHGEVQPVSIDELGKFFQRVQRALPITPSVCNKLFEVLGIDEEIAADMDQDELKELLILAGLESKVGLSEGSSGTGDTQAGGASSAINSENAS